MAQKFPVTSGGESGYFSQLLPSRTLRQDETEYQPTHQRKKKEERKEERERPNRRKRQIHLAPSLRQVDVPAEASPTRKEEKKARTRKERNRVSSKCTYQERAGQEKKKRTEKKETGWQARRRFRSEPNKKSKNAGSVNKVNIDGGVISHLELLRLY